MNAVRTTSAAARDLVDGLAERPYLFVEHRLNPDEALSLRTHSCDYRSFLVVTGTVLLEYLEPGGGTQSRSCGRLQGWHALPGSVYRCKNVGDDLALVLEAGTISGEVEDVDRSPAPEPAASCLNLAGYRVSKPWGFELWYTENLPERRYAFKQIHMTAGYQSSLQSHRQKIETNYVVDGEATVLGGLLAPEDREAVVDVAALPVAVNRTGTTWTSDRNVLHRVVARSDYTSVEVSTPELDDVIRWADDTGRPHGRIRAEHAGAAASGTTGADIVAAVRLYLAEQRAILEAFPVEAVTAVTDALFETYDRGGTVYAVGNGGNAGTLDHAYCDFKHHPFLSEDKSRPVPVGVRRLHFVNLCGSAAELTGLVNDLGPASMYTASLEPFITADDLVMAYSGSGNSANVIRALEVAARAGARTFAMTKGTGGRCSELADICLVVPGTSRFPGQTGSNDNNFHFEDLMLSLNHILVGLLKQRVHATF